MGKKPSKPLDHELLRKLMQSHDPPLKSESLGQILGVNNTTTGRWCRGETGPNGAEAVALCRLFGVSASTLYGYRDTPAEAVFARIARLSPIDRAALVARINGWLDHADASGSPGEPPTMTHAEFAAGVEIGNRLAREEAGEPAQPAKPEHMRRGPQPSAPGSKHR